MGGISDHQFAHGPGEHVNDPLGNVPMQTQEAKC
jgi:hypothetical protein